MLCEKCAGLTEQNSVVIGDMSVTLCLMCQRDYTIRFDFGLEVARIKARRDGLKYLLKAGQAEYYEEFLVVAAKVHDLDLQHNIDIQRWLDE